MLKTAKSGVVTRRLYRGLNQANCLRQDVGYGEVGRIRAPSGSVVSITHVDGGSSIWLTALAEDRRVFDLSALDLPSSAAEPVVLGRFDDRMMRELIAARGGSLENASGQRLFGDGAPGESFIFRLRQKAEVFVIAPIAPDYICAGGGAAIRIEVKPPDGQTNDLLMPDPLGKMVDEFRVSRGTAKAYEVKKGQFVQVIDVEGQQCSDFMALRADALEGGIERCIDFTVSRTMTRAAYPLPGLFDKFYDQDMRPLMAVRQDTVGRHDTFALACTARGYEERGYPGHLNCSDNISEAFDPYGIERRRAWPAINFFFNSWIDWRQNVLAGDEAWSRPGDYVAMEALTDLVCVSTACPDDVDPINGWNPTDIHVRVYEKDSALTHSVVWRANPEDAGKLTRHSAFHPRTSALTSSFGASRDLWVPAQFDGTGAIEEYWATKNTATLQDMSGTAQG